MTLKLKLLRILAFALEEFDKGDTHLAILVMEEIEDEALRLEQRLLTTAQTK